MQTLSVGEDSPGNHLIIEIGNLKLQLAGGGLTPPHVKVKGSRCKKHAGPQILL